MTILPTQLVNPSKFRHYSGKEYNFTFYYFTTQLSSHSSTVVVANSSLVQPNEIHLFVEHLKYQTKSAVAQSSPLLAERQDLVQQYGAASDYIVSKSLPRHSLAIDLLETMANLKRGDNDYEKKLDDLKFNLSDERRQSLKYHAYLDEDEIDSVIERASAMPGGQAMFINLLRAVTDEISTTVDPRDLTIVLKSYESPRFRLPALLMSKPQPIIMIAGGTGISPFRGLFVTRYHFMHYNYMYHH